MTDEERAEIKAIVRETVMEIMAKLRPMPTPAAPSPTAPFTEIIIRTGPPGAVQVSSQAMQSSSQGRPIYFGCPPDCCCCDTCPPDWCCCFGVSWRDAIADEEERKLLRKVQEATGESPEEIVRKMDHRLKSRQIAEEMKKYAEEIQESEEAKEAEESEE